jgi:hypothetical protein
MSERVISTLLCIVKDEGPYIIEWIAYHKVIGFERIMIYDNDSGDGSGEVLRLLGDLGEIDYVPWPWPADHPTNPQSAAYQDGLARVAGRTDWLCILDADEFLVLKRHGSVNALLADYRSVNGLAVHWNVFGSNGLTGVDDRPVIERFTRCGGVHKFVAKHIKSFARVDAVTRVAIHYFVLRQGRYVNTEFRDVKPAPVQDIPTHEVAQINHYFSKTYAEWTVKRARGRADRTARAADKFRPDYQWATHDQNDHEDLTILARLPETKAEMARLSGCLLRQIPRISVHR